MGAVDVWGIKVSCGIPYLEIIDLECMEQVNEHADIRIKLQVSEETLSWLDTHSLCGKILKIDIAIDEHRSVRLCGDMVSAQWERNSSRFYIAIRALSVTRRMDEKKRTCIYQRKAVICSDFLQEITGKYRGNSLVAAGNGELEMCPVLQYRETDWELILRLAAERNTVVLVNAGSEVPEFSLGCVRGKDYSVSSFLKLRETASEKGFYIHTWETYMLGDQVNVAGKRLTVLEKRTKLNRGSIEYTYWAGNAENRIRETERKPGGISVRGIITKTEDEYVSLDFGEKGDGGSAAQNCRYPYLPATGNILYAMPEKGAEAELYVPSSDEKQAYVRNCFLPSSEWPDESVKFFETSGNKGMVMRPGEILWAARSGHGEQTIRLQDRHGILMSADRDLILKAEGNIHIKAGMSCMVTAKAAIVMEQSNTVNSIRMAGSTIQMRSERYETASADRGKKTNIQPVDTVPDYDLSVLQQYVLAAVPRQPCDTLTGAALASVPSILSARTGRNSGSGYFG